MNIELNKPETWGPDVLLTLNIKDTLSLLRGLHLLMESTGDMIKTDAQRRDVKRLEQYVSEQGRIALCLPKVRL